MIKTDLSNAISSTEQLHQKAVIFYRSKLEKDPRNISYLSKIGHLLREIGELQESLECFAKIRELDPQNSEALLISSILSQNPVNLPWKNDFSPTPFYYIEDYLSETEQESIWQTIFSKKDNFTDSKLNNEYKTGKIDIDVRSSSTLYENDLKTISEWMLKKIFSMMPEVWPYVQMIPFSQTYTEFRLTRHGDNDYFKIHRDSGDDKPISSRALTFVYYFHKEPKFFKGGEILLFDTDTKNADFNTRYTKLIPRNNSIVFFPSNYFHQVNPVSLKDDLFENGRFAIHGWLHREIL